MFRWDSVSDQDILGMTVKMYRNPFVAKETFISPIKNNELDYYAYKYMQSELYTYQILDTNFENYIEERGDTFRIDSIQIPSLQDNKAEVY